MAEDPVHASAATRRGGAFATGADPERLERLTERELEILRLMAGGWSNAGIAERLAVSPRTVESHVRWIFIKLGLLEAGRANRRVLAVLSFLSARDIHDPGLAAPDEPRLATELPLSGSV